MIAAWIRRVMTWRARRRHAIALRYEATEYLRQAQQLQVQSDAAYAAACKREYDEVTRSRLYCLAFRLGDEARAARARAGGDSMSAEMHATDAAWWHERGQQYVARETADA